MTMAEVSAFSDERYAGFEPWMGKNFNAIVTNDDGKLTTEELEDYSRRPPRRMRNGMRKHDRTML